MSGLGRIATISVNANGVPARRPGRPAKPSPKIDVDQLIAIVQKNPGGIRSESLRAKLGLEKIPFRAAAAKAVDAKAIVRTGEKRSTTFFPKS